MVLSKSTPIRTIGFGQPQPNLGSADTLESRRYFLRDVLGSQPELSARVFLRADFVHEDIVGAETEHATPRVILGGEPLSDGAAQSAQAAVLLHHRDERVARKDFLQPISIQRLDRMKALDAR